MAEKDKARERERFERIYEEHFGRVAGYLLARADRELAQDALSKTFEVAWRRIGEVPAAPLPWLLGVARKVLAETRRAQGRRDALVERIASSLGAQAVDRGEAMAEREHTLMALARLSEPQREALLLIAWDGLSEREAAKALKCSRGAIALRVHRARASLRRDLGRETEELQSPGGLLPRPAKPGESLS